MSLSVVFRRVAKREFDDAYRGIKIDVKDLAASLALPSKQRLGRIALSPNQLAYVRDDVRRAVLKRFPYSIYFIVEDERIVVLAVFHARRAPNQLEDRC